LLYLEYLEPHPDGYRYTRFCDLYRRWLKRRGLTMRQVHHAGEKLFVDYVRRSVAHPAGPGLAGQPPRAFAFLGGVTTAVVPDQLKSGVVVACRYEPGLQRTYQELTEHYGMMI
jgi:transposase